MTDKNKIELIKNIIDIYYDAMPGIEDNKERDLYQQGILDCINSIIHYEEKTE